MTLMVEEEEDQVMAEDVMLEPTSPSQVLEESGL